MPGVAVAVGALARPSKGALAPPGYGFLRVGAPGGSQIIRIGADGGAPRILIPTGA